MKKKLLALVCALALTVSLVGCALSTPDTVGKIGDFEVTSGLYLLAQYDAYQQAAQLADSEQDTSKVNSFLKATITTDADTGETAVVKDYVAQKTLETLQTLAAVDARFTELGGELTEEQKSAADSYAQQLMDNYGDAYTANGIGLETLKLFQQLQYKQVLLLDLVYGKDGETPVEDGELTEHLDSTMYEIGFITVPLYNTSTFAFANDDQKAEMLSLAQKAVDSYNAAAPEDASSQMAAFNSIASSALTDICAVLDAEVPSTSTLQTDLLSESDLTDAFTQEGAADTGQQPGSKYRAILNRPDVQTERAHDLRVRPRGTQADPLWGMKEDRPCQQGRSEHQIEQKVVPGQNFADKRNLLDKRELDGGQTVHHSGFSLVSEYHDHQDRNEARRNGVHAESAYGLLCAQLDAADTVDPREHGGRKRTNQHAQHRVPGQIGTQHSKKSTNGHISFQP